MITAGHAAALLAARPIGIFTVRHASVFPVIMPMDGHHDSSVRRARRVCGDHAQWDRRRCDVR